MIEDGALAPLKVLLWATGSVTEAETARVIREAVTKGMTLIVPADWHPRTPEGESIFPADCIGGRPAEKKGTGPIARVIPMGKGYVVEAQKTTFLSSIDAMASMIREPDAYGIPPLSKEVAMDGRRDEVYLTITTEDVLLYNHGDEPRKLMAPQGEIEVPAHAIISLPRHAFAPQKAPD